jgi:hypothetical protein
MNLSTLKVQFEYMPQCEHGDAAKGGPRVSVDDGSAKLKADGTVDMTVNYAHVICTRCGRPWKLMMMPGLLSEQSS